MEKTPKNHLIRPIIMISLGMMFIVFSYFVQVAPSVMSTQLMSVFSISAGSLGVLGSLFLFSYAILQLPAGMLLDRYGARIMMALAIVTAGAGLIVFSYSQSLSMAGFSRVLAGAGSAFSFLGGLYLAARWFSHRHFALIAGSLQMGAGLGSIIGEAPLASLVNQYGWRDAMLGIGVVMLLFAFIVWLVVRNEPKHFQKTTPTHSEEQSSKLTAFKNSSVWYITLFNFISWFPAGAIGALWGVPYLMAAFHWTNTQAGALFIALWIAVGMMAPVLGGLSDRWKRRQSLLLGALWLGLAGSIILLLADHLPITVVVIGLFLLGIPPASQSVSFATLKDTMPAKHYASASAMGNMGTLLGGAIGQILIGYLVDWSWSGQVIHSIPLYTIGNYKFGLLITPILMLIGLVITRFKIKETFAQNIAN